MTTEQKAKAYDEALEKARKRVAVEPQDHTDAILKDIFPELRESEDEIHRKWILEYLYDGLRKADEQFKDHFKSAIDWLEKQKEQKPAEVDESTKRINENWMKQYFDEQKPAEWSMNDEAAFGDLLWCIEQARHSAKDENDMGSIWYAEKWLKERLKSLCLVKQEWNEEDEVLRQDCIRFIETGWTDNGKSHLIPWLKSLPERFNLQPKRKWSEEDEKMIDTIISVLGQYIDYKAVSGTGSGYATPRYSKEIDWLKSLRSQPKQEWSEKDKTIIEGACNALKIYGHTKLASMLESICPVKQEWSEEDEKMLDAMIDIVSGSFYEPLCPRKEMLAWLKSIRPSWKPSEEQMKALQSARFLYRDGLENSATASALESLYIDLKKL